MRLAARALIGFWLVILSVLLGGAIILQWLGPPHPIRSGTRGPAAAIPSGSGSLQDDAVLLQPATEFPGRFLPRKAPDGTTAAERYRSRSGLPAQHPMVAVLLEGLGLTTDIDGAAVEALPPAISLAVSPYAAFLQRPQPHAILDRARRLGHELWLSLPMEPAAATADEGGWALRRSADLPTNRHALDWSLSRFTGYVGLTDASSGLFGEGYADGPGFSLVADALLDRGLLYVEGGSAAHDGAALPPPGSSRHADLVLDGHTNAVGIDDRLAALERLASDEGTAVAIASPMTPVLVDRLRRWSTALSKRGIALVPVSALIGGAGSHPPVQPPGTGPTPKGNQAS